MRKSPDLLLAFTEYGSFSLSSWADDLSPQEAASVVGGSNSTCFADGLCFEGPGPNVNAICGGFGVSSGGSNDLCGNNIGVFGDRDTGVSVNGKCG